MSSPTPDVMKIAMSGASITDREIELVMDVMKSGVLSIGPMVQRFEEAIAARVGVKHAIAVSSGTCGLHQCVVSHGIGPGDEVITTPFSFVASANVIAFERAQPVFVDIDPVSLNIDPALIEAKITPRTKAILPVHVFGQPADMDAINDIARRHGLAVIEDACEALGSEYRGRNAGTFGDAAVFAFYPNKQMTTGEGGVIVTNRDDLAAIHRSLRNQGRDVHDGWLDHSRLGYNYRMSDLHAAIGVAQLERFDQLVAARAAVADSYTALLSKVPGVTVATIVPSTTLMSWFVYTIRLDRGVNRDDVVRRLAERGVPSRPYFPLIHKQPYFKHLAQSVDGAFPVAEAEAGRMLALPFHGGLTSSEATYVVDALRAVLS